MNEYWKGFLITLAGVIVISPDTLLLRLVDADVWTVVLWRGLLSGLTILAWCAWRNRGGLGAILAGLGPDGWAMAAAFGVANILFVLSVHLTTVANTLFLVSTSPIFAALLSWAVLGERVSGRAWAAIAATMTGVAIIAWGGPAHGGAESLAGDAAALGVALSIAITFNIARRARERSLTAAVGVAGLISGSTSGVMVLLGAAPAFVAQGDVVPLLIMALIVSPVGAALINMGPRYIPAPEVSLILLVEAILGPLMVWAVLAEAPPVATLAGGAVILSALAVLNVARMLRPARAATAPAPRRPQS